ncbi:MAG: GNAT family N-acetyltransferase [Proteobacteria bacterium]|nr:MAG: GNAT family N-acetyltransferase [Pseudomonadota bacterium]
MEMLAYSKLDVISQNCSQERFYLSPLDKSLEAQTVEVIQNTLIQLQSVGAELGATKRKLSSFHEAYTKPGTIYLVLIDSLTSRVVGGVGIVPFAGLDPSEGIGEIRELTVDNSYRRQGLGLRLLQAAFDTAVGLQYKRLYLEATEHMVPAEALFLRFGFRPVAIHQKNSKKRKDPLIRQTGQPAFFVWEDPSEDLRSGNEPQHSQT